MSSGIDTVLQESRSFDPPKPGGVGADRWLVSSMDEYQAMHARSIDDPEAFWREEAGRLHWFKDWSRACDFEAPDAKWFVGGTTNLCFNCVDRHVDAGVGDDIAIVWEGEPIDGGEPEISYITYADLKRDTAKFANVLTDLGVKQGDVVTIYMRCV